MLECSIKHVIYGKSFIWNLREYEMYILNIISLYIVPYLVPHLGLPLDFYVSFLHEGTTTTLMHVGIKMVFLAISDDSNAMLDRSIYYYWRFSWILILVQNGIRGGTLWSILLKSVRERKNPWSWWAMHFSCLQHVVRKWTNKYYSVTINVPSVMYEIQQCIWNWKSRSSERQHGQNDMLWSYQWH